MIGRIFEGIENMEPTEIVMNITLKGLEIDFRPNVLMEFNELKNSVEHIILKTSEYYNLDVKAAKLLLSADDMYVLELINDKKLIINVKAMVTYKNICLSALKHYKNHFDNLGIYDNVICSFKEFCDTIINYIK